MTSQKTLTNNLGDIAICYEYVDKEAKELRAKI